MGMWLLLVICLTPSSAQTLSSAQQAKIDDAIHQVFGATGVLSASLAIVKNGRIAYVHAYGDARREPQVSATPTMRYPVGSISKQFTASAILLLAEEGKLSLDDPVARFLPELTRAKEVSVRQLLSHTAGYQDYWPQDYVPSPMLEPVRAEQIMKRWAQKPLDFDPGTKWQYSNTNYVIAGQIVEKAARQSLFSFLKDRIFSKLQMESVWDVDDKPLGATDPQGYMRYALGPLRPAPKEGRGWLFAAGELAMTAEDLAKWDIAMLEQKLLKPASYRQFETDVLLKSGLATGYGLGVRVILADGRRALVHDGEVSGFTAENAVFPDDGIAIVVLTNQDAASAAGEIVRLITPVLFADADTSAGQTTAQARQIFDGLQRGTINRTLFTSNGNAYFDERALADFAASLKPLGTPAEFTQTAERLRGGMTERVYNVKFSSQSLRVWTYEMPDGKLEQYQVAAQ
jgi:CubicO group peptidase (beta-lactamase class C family)